MPAHLTNHKSNYERLEARISPEKKIFLKHAADLEGRSLTDFVISAAYQMASQVIKEHEQIKLSIEDCKALIHALDKPSSHSKSLMTAIKKYKKDVISK